MNLGKILGSISPAFGIASGKGLFGNRDLLGSISPLYGMASGKGLFGGMEGMGGMGLGGLLGLLLGKGGGEEEGQTTPGARVAPVPQGSDMTEGVMGFDPVSRGQQQEQGQPRLGQPGWVPFGHLGRFLGRVF